jgi:hypothetical protein
MGHCLESYSVAYSDGYLARESEIMMVLEWGNA